jgi:hypothetical protein
MFKFWRQYRAEKKELQMKEAQIQAKKKEHEKAVAKLTEETARLSGINEMVSYKIAKATGRIK